MRRCLKFVSFCLLASLGVQAAFSGPLGTFVVVGDSLSAGFQNFSLYTSETIPGLPPAGQRHGYAELVAQQAGTDLRNPTILYPGFPPTLTINGGGEINKAPGVGLRLNPEIQTLNLSVPSYTVADANGRTANILQVLTNPLGANPQDILELTVLGFPSFCGALDFPLVTVTLSSVACAVQQHPQTILVSLGSNDALLTLLLGIPPTTKESFQASYHQMITTLQQQTSARIMVSNVPDLTLIPYLWTQQNFQARCGYLPKTQLATDYVVADLTDATASGDVCTSYFVRSAELVNQTKSMVDEYNKIIKHEAQSARAVVLDLNKLVADMAAHGTDVGGKHLTTAFLGGLFSLDGIHPTNTGYGIIANQAIETMNKAWKLSIPPVSITAIAATDPLVPGN